MTGVNIGTAAADRDVYVFVSTNADLGSGSPDSVTVGGVSATEITSNGVTISNQNLSLWRASVPSGTTATVVVQDSDREFSTEVHVSVYAAYGRTAGTPVTATATTGTDVSLDLTVSAGSDIIAAAEVRNGGMWSWVGLTEDDEVDLGTGEYVASASATNVSAGTRTITASQGAGGRTRGGISVELA
jgi:hypothetical protein